MKVGQDQRWLHARPVNWIKRIDAMVGAVIFAILLLAVLAGAIKVIAG